MACRVLPHTLDPGAAQMAMDEALMTSAAEPGSTAVARTYGWSRPTLSLGYFQSIGQAEADPRWSGVEVVRRPTGGGAIWHDGDLTYAVVIPRTHPLAGTPGPLYAAVHGAIASALADLGVDLERRGAADGPHPRPLLCFLDRDSEDLLLGGSKVVGSAQRRRRGAVLQHGSILLRGSPRTPELPGIEDRLGREFPASRIAEGVLARIVERLGLEPIPGEVEASERVEADRLQARVYESADWNRRR